MPSSSIRLPCSIDATPARTARLIASAPWACAATLRPHMAASSTAAFISSCENCGAPADCSSDSTPALASSLITSAPFLTSNRTSFRISSGTVGQAGELAELEVGRETDEVTVAARRADGQEASPS